MPDFAIYAGDFNISLQQEKDTKHYIHENNPQATKALKEQMDIYGLIDVWRHQHPDDKQFTWRQFNGSKQARLDFFLISSSLLPFVEKSKISPGFNSDHSVIELDIDFSKFVRGKGFWKFNSSLLYDPSNCSMVKNTLKRVVAQYGIIESNINFYETVSKEVLIEFYNNSTPESL